MAPPESAYLRVGEIDVAEFSQSAVVFGAVETNAP